MNRRHHPLAAFALALGSALSAGPAAAAEETHVFRGYAFDLETGAYRYTEVHKQVLDGFRWLEGTIDYYDPAGKKIAAKTLDLRADPQIPVMRMEIFAERYIEAIPTVTATDFTLEKTVDGKTRRKRIDKTPDMAADSGFHGAIVQNFERLQAGETLRFQFAVAGQLDRYSFRCRKIGDTTVDGKPAIRLAVEPDSLLRLLVDRLDLTYDVALRRLQEYRGISNMHDDKTGKAYNVRIVYTDTPPPGAPKTLPPLPPT